MVYLDGRSYEEIIRASKRPSRMPPSQPPCSSSKAVEQEEEEDEDEGENEETYDKYDKKGVQYERLGEERQGRSSKV